MFSLYYYNQTLYNVCTYIANQYICTSIVLNIDI